ncbi:MAG: hypothetical protein KAI24_23735, partial [Planctomycetes bacterium]|nr:hypothetical protein [Planctomycetota bacterium]
MKTILLMRRAAQILTFSCFAAAVAAQGNAVVPASSATTDANSLIWIPGASQDVRQQILIGTSHLSGLIGQQITALEWRRSAEAGSFAAGTAHMSITISSEAVATYDCSSAFASNIAPNAVQVFNGTVNIPASPGVQGNVVPWSSQNTVRIVFQTPFTYNGGRLCIDALGSSVSGQQAEWWPADANWDQAQGTVVNVGGGCGAYAGHTYIDEHSIVVGSPAAFTTFGTPWGFAIAATGQAGPAFPLTLLGFNP